MLISFFFSFVSSILPPNVYTENDSRYENISFVRNESTEFQTYDTPPLLFDFDSFINLTRDSNLTGGGASVYVIGNGIEEEHEEFIGIYHKTEGLITYWENDPKNIYYQDGYQPYETNVSAKIEGSHSASIAFGKNYGIAPNVHMQYYPFAFHQWFQVQLFTEVYRDISNADIVLFSADHYTFRIISGDQANPYVELVYWTNSTEAVTRQSDNQTIVIMSAGNRGDQPFDIQYHSLGYLPNTGVVTAVTHLGSVAWYSEWSVSVLCCAPGGGTDTKTFGNARTNPKLMGAFPIGNNYTGSFGTNAASAIVAGVAALLKDKYKEQLDFRNFKYRVAITSTLTDPSSSYWIKNAAGFYHHPGYGFGLINAQAMLDLELPDIGESTYDEHFPPEGQDDPQYIPYGNEDNDPINISVINTSVKTIEEIELRFSTKTAIFTDLTILLTSPQGTTSSIRDGGIGRGFRDYPKTKEQPLERYVMTSRAFFGEKPKGTWRLQIKHSGYTPLDQIWSISLAINGSTLDLSDTIHSQQKEGLDPYNYTKPEIEQIKLTPIENATEANKYRYTCEQNISYSFPAGYFRDSLEEGVQVITFQAFIRHLHTHEDDKDEHINESVRLFNLNAHIVKLTREQIENNETYTNNFSMPCIVSENVTLVFGVRDTLRNIVIMSHEFNCINNHQSFTVIYREPYETFMGENNRHVVFHYARNNLHLPEHGFRQHVQVMIFDLYSRELVYTSHEDDNGFIDIVFPMERSIRRGVLSISSMNNISDHNCKSVIYPFRWYNVTRDDYPKSHFRVPIENNEYCPVGTGIETAPRRYIQEMDNAENEYIILFFGLCFPLFVFIAVLLFALFAQRLATPKQNDPSSPGELNLTFVP